MTYGFARNMKRAIAAVSAVAALCGVAACGAGSKTASSGDANGGKTARFLYATGDETWNATVKAVVDAYNKQSTMGTVVAEPLTAGSDYATAMKTMDATNNWPTIVDMRDYTTYAKAGKLAPIPSEVTDLLQDDAYAPYSDGNVYLVPNSANNGEIGINIVYNKDYFNEHDLEVPTTWDEFIKLMDDIKANGDTPLATAAAENWPSDQIFKPIANSVFAKHSAEHGGYWMDVANGKASLDELKEPMEKVKMLIDNYVLSGWQSTQDAQTTTLLVTGKTVMATTSAGLGRLKDINKVKSDFNAGMFLIPDEEGNLNVVKNAVGDTSTGLALSAQSKENGTYDLGVDFLKYFYSVEGSNVVEQSGTISANIKDSDKVTRNESIPGSEDYFALLKNPKLKWISNESPTEGTFSSFTSFFRQARVAYQDNQKDLDTTIAELKAEFAKDVPAQS